MESDTVNHIGGAMVSVVASLLIQFQLGKNSKGGRFELFNSFNNAGANQFIIVRWGSFIFRLWVDAYFSSQITIRSFHHSTLITGLATRVTRRCYMWNKNYSPFRSTWVHPSPVFRGVRDARYLIFCVMYCLFFFDLHLLITPVVSSNCSYTQYVGKKGDIEVLCSWLITGFD